MGGNDGGSGKRHCRRYSAEEIEWLQEHVPGSPMRLIVERFNARFGCNATYNSVQSACLNRGIRTNTRSSSWNNGRKECAKGGKWRPVGTEVVNRDGYRIVKVSDDYGDKSVRWKMKHVLVWEQTHGPVPEGHVVIFQDGDKSNCDIDNLLLVSRGELCQLNRMGLITTDADLTKCGTALVKLRLAVKRRERGRRG